MGEVGQFRSGVSEALGFRRDLLQGWMQCLGTHKDGTPKHPVCRVIRHCGRSANVHETGLRCADTQALEWRDIRLGDEPMVTVRKGKGGKARQVPIHPELCRALELGRHRRPSERISAFSLRTAASWSMLWPKARH